MICSRRNTNRGLNAAAPLLIWSLCAVQRTSFNDFAERTAAANRKNRCSVSQLLEASVVRGLAEWHLAEPSACYCEPCQSRIVPFRVLTRVCWLGSSHVQGFAGEAGSGTLVRAAGVGSGMHGRYWDDCMARQTAPLVLVQEGKRLQEKRSRNWLRDWERFSREYWRIHGEGQCY